MQKSLFNFTPAVRPFTLMVLFIAVLGIALQTIDYTIGPDLSQQIQASFSLRQGMGYTHLWHTGPPDWRMGRLVFSQTPPGYSILFLAVNTFIRNTMHAVIFLRGLSVVLALLSIYWILRHLGNSLSQIEKMFIVGLWSLWSPRIPDNDLISLSLLLYSSWLFLKILQGRSNLATHVGILLSSTSLLWMRYAYLPIPFTIPICLLILNPLPRKKNLGLVVALLFSFVLSILLMKYFLWSGQHFGYARPKLDWENLLTHHPFPIYIFGIAQLGQKFWEWGFKDQQVLLLEWFVCAFVAFCVLWRVVQVCIAYFKNPPSIKKPELGFEIFSTAVILATEVFLSFCALTHEKQLGNWTPVAEERYFAPAHFFIIFLFVLFLSRSAGRWRLLLFPISIWISLYAFWHVQRLEYEYNFAQSKYRRVAIEKISGHLRGLAESLTRTGYTVTYLYPRSCEVCSKSLFGLALGGGIPIEEFQFDQMGKVTVPNGKMILVLDHRYAKDEELYRKVVNCGFKNKTERQVNGVDIFTLDWPRETVFGFHQG